VPPRPAHVYPPTLPRTCPPSELTFVHPGRVLAPATCRFLDVSAHYADLQQPFRERRAALAASLELQRLLLEANDEAAWVTMKLPVAESTDYGSNLSSARILVFRLEAFDLEMTTRQARMANVQAFAERLLAQQHYAAAVIAERVGALVVLWGRLREAAALRARMLEESHDMHLHLVDVAELVSALRDKEPSVANERRGDSLDESATLLSKHDALMGDLLAFAPSLEELRAGCEALAAAGNHGMARVQEAQDGLELLYDELQTAASARRRALEEAVQQHAFHLEHGECLAWLQEALATASSADVGEDQDRCELLRKRFADFASDVRRGVERVEKTQGMARTLVAGKHSAAPQLQEAAELVTRLWGDLTAQVEQRRRLLEDAQAVHAFHRDADETMEWISQKEDVRAHATVQLASPACRECSRSCSPGRPGPPSRRLPHYMCRCPLQLISQLQPSQLPCPTHSTRSHHLLPHSSQLSYPCFHHFAL